MTRIVRACLMACCAAASSCASQPSAPSPAFITLGITDLIIKIPASSSSFIRSSATFSATYRTQITWNDPTVDVDFYITDDACASLAANPLQGNCAIAAYSQRRTGASEVIFFSAQAGSTYRTWFVNHSAVDVSVAFSQ